MGLPSAVRATKTNKSICYASLTQQLSLCCSLMLFGIRRELLRQLAARSQSQRACSCPPANRWASWFQPLTPPTPFYCPKFSWSRSAEESRQYLQKWPQGRDGICWAIHRYLPSRSTQTHTFTHTNRFSYLFYPRLGPNLFLCQGKTSRQPCWKQDKNTVNSIQMDAVLFSLQNSFLF